MVIAITVTYRWGIQAIIYGQIVVSILAYYLNSYYSGKFINYPMKEQMFDLAPYPGVAMIMGVGIYFIQWLPFSNNLALLATQVLVGFSVYTAIGCLFKMPAFNEVINISKDKLEHGKIWHHKN